MRAITKSTTNVATTPPAAAPAMIPLPTPGELFMPDGPAAVVARALTVVDCGSEPGVKDIELEAAKGGDSEVVAGGLEVLSFEVIVVRVVVAVAIIGDFVVGRKLTTVEN